MTTLIKDGKRSCHYLIEITDALDTLVATVSSSDMYLEKQQKPALLSRFCAFY